MLEKGRGVYIYTMQERCMDMVIVSKYSISALCGAYNYYGIWDRHSWCFSFFASTFLFEAFFDGKIAF